MSKSPLILLRIRGLFNCFYQPCQTDALNNNFSNYCFMSTQLSRGVTILYLKTPGCARGSEKALAMRIQEKLLLIK